MRTLILCVAALALMATVAGAGDFERTVAADSVMTTPGGATNLSALEVIAHGGTAALILDVFCTSGDTLHHSLPDSTQGHVGFRLYDGVPRDLSRWLMARNVKRLRLDVGTADSVTVTGK
jgi:hypothetical protein